MNNIDLYKEFDNDNIKEQIIEIKRENPNLENEILKTKKTLLKDISIEDKKNGEWFSVILKKVLDTHVKNISFEKYKEKYKSSQKDIIAKKIIDSACKVSAITGGVLGAGGAVLGPLSAIPATFGEIVTVTYFQLNMICELALIYGKPINLDDPEESYKILLLSLGIKSSELVNGVIKNGAKRGGKFAVDQVGKRVVLSPLQKLLRLAGIKITQRSMKNFFAKSIPVIGIGIGGTVCSIIDYNATKIIANNTLSIYRTRELIIERFEHDNLIPFFDKKSFDTLIKGCMLVANADVVVDIHKTILIEHINNSRFLHNNYNDRIKLLDKEFFEPYEKIEDLEIKKTIFFTLELVAASDRKISKNEQEILVKAAACIGKNKKVLDEELKVLIKYLYFI